MSDGQEFHSYPSEDGMASHNESKDNMLSEEHFMPRQKVQNLREAVAELEASIDQNSYPIGEVPQSFQVDPEVALALNSERVHNLSKLVEETNELIKEEVIQIQKFQKNIDHWESKVEQNKAMIQKNKDVIRKNNTEIVYDKKNRDYWWGRAEQVQLDYNTAEATDRTEVWTWLVKKYGLKNPDGSIVNSHGNSVEEICNGCAKNLEGEYRMAGNKYEQAKKDKEAVNTSLIRDNGRFKDTIDVLQKYVQNTYTRSIEPLQDGVLLLKELGAKLKSLPEGTCYGDLRAWAEDFLNQYLQENPDAPQNVVSDFRKIASIPLPPENT
jgi:hypothetical protein